MKKGRAFASSSVGGLSGAFIPVSDDLNISEAVQRGHLYLKKMEAMAAVCSVGVRLISAPGEKPGEKVVFGGLFGEATIAEVRGINRSSASVSVGGKIPAPITSINN